MELLENPRPRLRGRGWHEVPGEGLADGCASVTKGFRGGAE